MNEKEDIPEVSPEELDKADRILDHEIKQMELTKGRVQILALNVGIVGGFLAIAKFILEYGLEWFKAINTGGN